MSSSRRRVIWIVGGTGGLGTEVTREFLREEATVIVGHSGRTNFGQFKKKARLSSKTLYGVEMDVLDEAQVSQVAKSIAREHKRIDVLIHLVGAFSGGVDVADTPPGDISAMLDLNLKSAFLLCRAVLPVLKKNKGGRIIMTGAIAALHPAPGMAAYAASKAGLVSLTRSLAGELKGTGITVNSVAPGIIDTPANRKAMPGSDYSQWASPKRLARIYRFLASEDAQDVTGSWVEVPGRA